MFYVVLNLGDNNLIEKILELQYQGSRHANLFCIVSILGLLDFTDKSRTKISIKRKYIF